MGVKRNPESIIRIMAPVLPPAENIFPYLKEIDVAGIYSNFGPLEKRLCSRLANHFDISTDLISTCANATLGLTGAIETSQAKLDTTWELPAWTFTASAAAIANTKYAAKFVDVDSKGRLIPSPTANAIIDVLPFGDEWDDRRLSSGIDFIVVDAAASFDALRYIPIDRDKPFAIILSLHATKLLPAGEGGLFISNDPDWVTRFRDWTKFGMEQGRVSSFLGTNAKISEYSAAVCHASLDEWPIVRNKWVSLADRAKKISSAHNLPITSAMMKDIISPYWVIQLNSASQKKLFATHLMNLGIETRDWWEAGCQDMPAYNHFDRSDLPTTKRLAACTIALPFHLRLTDSEWERIEAGIQRFFDNNNSSLDANLK